VGVIEKIVLDDSTMQAVEARARESGRTVDEEVVNLVQAALRVSPDRAALIEKFRAFRESLPPQTTDSLELLREDRNR